MAFPFANTFNKFERLWHLLTLLIIIFITFSDGVEADENEVTVTNIGAIVNLNNRIGKEQKTAMDVAAENFNSNSKNHSIILHFRHSDRDPLTAASAAQELIGERNVKVLIGMEDWNEAALVADVGNRAQVPVISFASPAITPPLVERRWPLLIRVGSNAAAQTKCIADVASTYNWKRVIVLYEDDGHGGDAEMLTLLSEALQDVGSKIEHRLVLPRVSSISNPNLDELEEMLKLPSFQSRVFIVLQSSLPTVTNLFRVAKQMGLVGRDSAWIITESITSFLDGQVNHDTQGTLGIKTYFASNTSSYANFNKAFQAKHPEGSNSIKPGIHALRAYDATRIVTQAIQMTSNSTTHLHAVLNSVLRNQMSLSGEVYNGRGEILSSSIFRIINVEEGNKYKELNFWSPEFGFSGSLSEENRSTSNIGAVVWPGNLSQRDPKGWTMPTTVKPFRVGVPNASFSVFVNVNGKSHTGFCIDIFQMVRKGLNYPLPVDIQYVGGSYNDLVELVHNKTLDAGVGDITILAERFDKVEYTQPYMPSVLVLILPAKAEYLEWTLLRPFSVNMWAATGGLLVYTILIVWYLESSVNPEFSGPLMNQIGTASWFAFNSLFFTQREKLYSNLTKVVVVVWLFVVFILVSSYTANLSSILTIQRLKPNVTDIEKLRSTNSKIGLDIGSYLSNYSVKVLNFKPENLIKLATELDYVEAFERKTISAALLEFPEAEVFMNQYCKKYTSTILSYRFGGLGFIFQKDSPIAGDFSKGILEMLEEGKMMSLEHTWLTPKHECPDNSTSDGLESLEFKNFMVLYGISIATSTICFLCTLVCLLKQYGEHQNAYNGNASDGSVPSRSESLVDVLEVSPSHLEHESAITSTPPEHESAITSTPPEHHLQGSAPAQTEGSCAPPPHG